MYQPTLDVFYDSLNPLVDSEYKNYIFVKILKDFNVAWFDGDWYLHTNDMVYLSPDLVKALEKRGIARTVDIKYQEKCSETEVTEGCRCI